MITIITKTFQELSTQELYALLQLRSEVFVVEQNCVYQDIDGKDEKALHVLAYKEGQLVAYTRVFKPGIYFKEASIGRVLVAEKQRKHKYGYAIMESSIEAIKNYYNEKTIKISAQTYLRKFYNNLGFVAIGEEYLEDGIPHIEMLKN
ncbi:GNAT family N-acetyltransferase [Oceanihabitans sediminis]|uniref:GNAT family N-acetyltransferase n=1 Tax=Oceanihabitans sediminis TaxID=1812012 RepID=A0A368P766_9FLAO|nr:GNAT family N-acetyltransferase [Oceanihabitans sediminis]MDX1277366.1 GNAT family N-acetyltransferase [Oceanihabitans sediminis]MDX1773024.1 GNAT family N-acetyltransferase [Oceanihabitans sediminis]RBP34717.1 ElaA protein [Oceanihabitans sediminis]RCU58368.1 GNAT family N-acetyltransferase [Oceanihabitans sediminis]